MWLRALKLSAYVSGLALFLIPHVTATAEERAYWPEYGTTAEHNRWAIKDINADKVHQSGITGVGVKVAVLDSGVAASTRGLSDKVIAFKDFVSSQPPLQEHGTMTASSVASDLEVATGISGSAPGVSLIIGRVCYVDACDNEAIRKAFTWAVDQGAQVISMSFGGGEDPYLNAAMLAATKRGVVVVVSMGNQGCTPIAYWGLNRYCILGKTTESFPAAHPIAGVIGTGASDHDHARAGFSSWGPNLDIMAPGVDVAVSDPVASNNGFSGTSASAPLVAGVVALVLSINPKLTPSEVQAILQATAQAAIETKPQVWDKCAKSETDESWNCNAQVESDFPQQYFTGSGIVDALAATELTKAITNGRTLEAPVVTSSLQSISVSWSDGPANLYMNSKLVAKNVERFETQGNYSQSFSFQIRRKNLVSKPALVLLTNEFVPTTPKVTEFSARGDEILLTTEDLQSELWQLVNNNQNVAGVFEFDDGSAIACTGYSPSMEGNQNRPYAFTCPSAKLLSSIGGTFRLVNKYSKMSMPSEHLTTVAKPAIKKMFVDVWYRSSDRIRFGWESIPGAQSYSYRWQPDGTWICTQDTSMEATGEEPQPSTFMVQAFPKPDCQGNSIIESDYQNYRLLLPTPPKPTGISVKEVNYTFTEFEIKDSNPDMYWHIYRSDGLMVRINPGQRFIVGMQPNEDVNNLSFSYRFMQIRRGTWGEVWSELSEPITVATKKLVAPVASCQVGVNKYSVDCLVIPNREVESTLIEYVDSDGQVLASTTLTNSQYMLRISKNSVRGASYVRVSATTGVAPYWYRRGEDRLIKVENRKAITVTHGAR